MLHKFIPSIKKGVSYCSECGCLSYHNIPSQNIMVFNSNQNIIKLDPLVIKYKPISLNIDFSIMSHTNYIKNRQKGLSQIYFLSSKFNIEKMIIHKAIGLMDQIYLNKKGISIQNIEIIASICLLLAFEFNHCCCITYKNESIPKNKISINSSDLNNIFFYENNIKSMNQYLIKKIKNIRYWQILCMKSLDYNLGKYSAFDYLKLFFELGIVFTTENFDILSIHDFCFNLLDILINQYSICKYNQYIIAMSIIYLKFNNNIYFNDKIFKYIYGVDFSKQKYRVCINEIKPIINHLYNLNICNIPFNNYQNINIIEKINKMNIFEYFESKYNYNSNNINKNILNNSLIKKLFTQIIIFFVQIGKINYQDFFSNTQTNNLYYEIFLSFLFQNNEIEQIKQNSSKTGMPIKENKEKTLLFEKEGNNFISSN